MKFVLIIDLGDNIEQSSTPTVFDVEQAFASNLREIADASSPLEIGDYVPIFNDKCQCIGKWMVVADSVLSGASLA